MSHDPPIAASRHAVDRWRGRFSPGAHFLDAQAEFLRQLAACSWQDAAPEWLADTPAVQAGVQAGYAVAADGSWTAPVLATGRGGLIAATCIPRGLAAPPDSERRGPAFHRFASSLGLSRRAVRTWRRARQFTGDGGHARRLIAGELWRAGRLEPELPEWAGHGMLPSAAAGAALRVSLGEDLLACFEIRPGSRRSLHAAVILEREAEERRAARHAAGASRRQALQEARRAAAAGEPIPAGALDAFAGRIAMRAGRPLTEAQRRALGGPGAG